MDETVYLATQLDSVYYSVVEGRIRLHIVKDELSRFPGCRPLACCGGDGVRLGAAAGVGIPGRRNGIARSQLFNAVKAYNSLDDLSGKELIRAL